MRAIDLASFAAAAPAPANVTPHAPATEPAQPLATLAAPGRIVELCGEARSTAAVSILAHCQREGETAAWIQPAPGDLYPPDLADAGVDLEALVVIHVPRLGPQLALAARQSAGPAGQCRAAELLLRSGGFGLLILDFTHAEPQSSAWQGRLLGLARQHEARLLILRGGPIDRPSLGPLIGLRVASRIEAATGETNDDPPGFVARTGRFWLVHEVLKNKSGGPLTPSRELIRGPWGLG